MNVKNLDIKLSDSYNDVIAGSITRDLEAGPERNDCYFFFWYRTCTVFFFGFFFIGIKNITFFWTTRASENVDQRFVGRTKKKARYRVRAY